MLDARASRLLGLIDTAAGPGLEIGPLAKPLVPSGFADVRYADLYSGETLRNRFAQDPNVAIEDIVDPDFVLLAADGNARPLHEAVGDAGPFAWAVASHVIEHVPDLIGWLKQVAAVLADDSLLLLAIPDRRYTFDACRPATTVGQMLQAHYARDCIPSVRAVYDHYRSVIAADPRALWSGRRADPLLRLNSPEDLHSQLAHVARGEYVDSHVWLFTPTSFVDQFAELGQLDLTDFTIAEVMPTTPGDIEFAAVLRRLPRQLSPDERAGARGAAESATKPLSRDTPGAQLDVTVSERELRVLLAKRRTLTLLRRVVSQISSRT